MNAPDETLLPRLEAQGVCILPHLGVMAAQGPEAALFLHNQLTNDFLLLDRSHARLAAFCNAKGRMQASMVGFKTSDDEVLLVLPKELLAQTLKRLSLFVLRAKVKLSDVSDLWAVRGHLNEPPDSTHVPWTLTHDHDSWRVGLYPAAGHARALSLSPMSSASAPNETLSLEDWRLSEVLSGIADVQQATFEAFVPQMLNYESVDGVNFKKGCYPGQEVVARSQFRGTLKRRTFLAQSASALQAGQELFHVTDASQPAGVVAQATTHPLHGHWALVCLQVGQTEGVLYPAGGSPDTPLTLKQLPYALRDDI